MTWYWWVLFIFAGVTFLVFCVWGEIELHKRYKINLKKYNEVQEGLRQSAENLKRAHEKFERDMNLITLESRDK